MDRVAVVVVTYNSAAEIGGCLDALARCNFRPELEIVVVDNASADRTRDEVVRRGIRLIANSAITGFAAAVNQGVRVTSAPLILLLNPDAHLLCGLDEMIVRCEDPQTGAVGGLLEDKCGNPQTGFMVRRLPTPAALIFEVLGINRVWPRNLVNWHYRCLSMDPMRAARVEQPAGAFLMFSRQVWKDLGGFDERFRPLWFEDVDFCARLGAAGLSVWYEPKARAKHAGSHSIQGISLENRRRYWYVNLLEYAAKHYPSAAFRAVCLAVATGCIFRVIVGVRREGRKALAIYGELCCLALSRVFEPRGDKE